MAEYRFLPEAAGDLEAAIDWYSQQSSAAANRFAEEVEATLSAIEKTPLRFSLLDERHRYAQLRKFPYIIAFRMAGNDPLVVAIQHTARGTATYESR